MNSQQPRRNRRRPAVTTLTALALVGAFVVSACGVGESEATPEPTPAPTEEPQATPEPTPTPTPEPTATPTPTPEPTPSPTPIPTRTPRPTPFPTVEPSPTPTPEPTPEPTVTPTPGPTLSPTPIPARTPRPTPRPTVEPTPTPDPTPVPTPTPTPFPSFAPEIIGYVIDPVTALPVVPEGVGGPWWWTEEPSTPLDPSLRYASEAPASGALDQELRRVSLLAEFGSYDEALALATELAAAVGDPEAEAAWLEAAGQDGASGFGWIGSEGSLTPFVQVIDRWLIVSELAYDVGADPGDDIEADPRYASPLALALHATADELVVEDTWSRDKSVAFDLACSGTAAELLTMSQDLADNGELYDFQPVWLEPGIDYEERRARRTLRLLNNLDNATLSSLVDDVEFQKLATNLREAGEQGRTAEDEALEELKLYIQEWVVALRPNLDPIAYLLDPVVLAGSASDFAQRAAEEVLVGELIRPQDVASGRFAASRFGAHDAPIPWIMGEAASYAELYDDQLSMSLGLFHGVAAGLGPLADYLDEQGCADIRAEFLDYGQGVAQREEEE